MDDRQSPVGLIRRANRNDRIEKGRNGGGKNDAEVRRDLDRIGHHQIEPDFVFLAIIVAARAVTGAIMIVFGGEGPGLAEVALPGMINTHAPALAAKQHKEKQDA